MKVRPSRPGFTPVVTAFQSCTRNGSAEGSLDPKSTRAIKARCLTPDGVGALLGIDQSKVSRITIGQFRDVDEAKLLELVARLGRDVTITIGPLRRRAGRIELQFA